MDVGHSRRKRLSVVTKSFVDFTNPNPDFPTYSLPVRVRGKASVRHRSIPTVSADNAVRVHAQASPKGATRTVRLGVATLGKDWAIAGDPRLDPNCSGGSVCREIRVRVSMYKEGPSLIPENIINKL